MPLPTAPLLPFAALLTFASPLAIRSDVEEARYLELGAKFPAVVQVGGLGSGTLVAPRFVLTAAHVPEMLQRMRKGKALEVAFGDKKIEVAKVHIPEARKAAPRRHDIALLELAVAAPKSVKPIPLLDTKVRAGTPFVLAGWGILAKGAEGVKMSPALMAAKTRARRAGWNVVSGIDEKEGLIKAVFDAPKDAHDLEASPCVGDSGGPILVARKGEKGKPARWHVAGVLAMIDDTDSDQIVGEYGESFGATPVASYTKWLRTTIDR